MIGHICKVSLRDVIFVGRKTVIIEPRIAVAWSSSNLLLGRETGILVLIRTN